VIPVASPGAAYLRRQHEYDAAMARVMASGQYVLGLEVEAFEAEFGAFAHLPFAVGVASGTEALWLALRAVGVGEADEVIVPALAPSATVAAIVESGARPVFADVRESDLTLDAAMLAGLVGKRTRAVVAVHLYGNPADATAIAAVCDAHGLVLVEDCAQAHGARHNGQPVGTFGQASAWSFYPTKNLGAFGDAGLIGTASEATAMRVRALRQYGWRQRGVSETHGWNSRLDELQAAILRVGLATLGADNARRRSIAQVYRQALSPALNGPVAPPSDLSVEHLFVVCHKQRDALRQVIQREGVSTEIHYPVPCHRQPAYQHFGPGPGSLLVAEQACGQVLSLPMFPELTDDEVQHVIAAVQAGLLAVSRTAA
jgi:dTDP-3-amino-3,4,6-trideoxy-alpha-D-glucose transaminase